MKCWRDLSKDCAEKDCPMWMTGFDLPENVDSDDLGLNDNMCALTINEKIGVFRQMLDMMESMESMDDATGIFDNEIFEVMEKVPKKSAKPKIPAAQGAKKKRPSTKNPQGKGKQLPIG